MIRLTVLLALCGLPVFAQNGQIVVSVNSSTGTAVSGAVVRVGARPIRNLIANFHQSKKTGTDGKAAFTAVPEGAYEICAQAIGGNLIDSCQWLNRPQQTYVHPGGLENVSIVLKPGSRVTISVSDTQSLLTTEAFPGQKLSLFIATKDSHHIPMMVTKQGNGHQFAALAPADTDLRVHVHSRDFQLADSSSNRLDMKNTAAYIPVHSLPAPIAGQAMALVASPLLTLQLVGKQ